jgi:hypothetical protein
VTVPDVLRNEPGVENAVRDGGRIGAANDGAREMAQLIRVGRTLAVLGIEWTTNGAALKWWHVVNPGTYNVPQITTGRSDPDSFGLCHATSLCGRHVVSNGYASDWKPPSGVLCPACAERV